MTTLVQTEIRFLHGDKNYNENSHAKNPTNDAFFIKTSMSGMSLNAKSMSIEILYNVQKLYAK